MLWLLSSAGSGGFSRAGGCTRPPTGLPSWLCRDSRGRLALGYHQPLPAQWPDSWQRHTGQAAGPLVDQVRALLLVQPPAGQASPRLSKWGGEASCRSRATPSPPPARTHCFHFPPPMPNSTSARDCRTRNCRLGKHSTAPPHPTPATGSSQAEGKPRFVLARGQHSPAALSGSTRLPASAAHAQAPPGAPDGGRGEQDSTGAALPRAKAG